MDALVELLPLLFIGLYYLLAGRRRAQRAKEAREANMAPQTELVSDEPRAPTPFQAFLEQLEAAAAEAAGVEEQEEAPPQPAPPPPPKPVPTQPLTPKPTPALAPAEFQAPAGSFDALAPVDHERHGFGTQNPLSEEAFEKAPAFGPRPAVADRRYDPHGLDHRRQPRELGRDWRAALRDPKAAREAFVLQTIFGPRGGRRAENR